MSINTLAEFIAQVEVTVRTVAGIRTVHDFPPDQLNTWPAVVAYAAKGYGDAKDFGLGFCYHDVACEVHIPQKDLARDTAKLLPFVTSMPEALKADPLLNAFYGAMNKISYSLFNEEYAGIQTIGYRFIIEKVKLDS
jgi:hypothetical protein